VELLEATCVPVSVLQVATAMAYRNNTNATLRRVAEQLLSLANQGAGGKYAKLIVLLCYIFAIDIEY